MITLYCVDSFDSIGNPKRVFYRDVENAKKTVRERIDDVPNDRKDYVTIRREVGPTEEAIRRGHYTTSIPIWSYGFFGLEGLDSLEK